MKKYLLISLIVVLCLSVGAINSQAQSILPIDATYFNTISGVNPLLGFLSPTVSFPTTPVDFLGLSTYWSPISPFVPTSIAPTLGLDVQISREVRKYIKTWVKENQDRTVLLTTHYMAEADELCHRVAVIDQGKVLACDTPYNLKKLLQKEAIYHIETSLMTNNMEKFSGIDGIKNFAYQHKSDVGKTKLKLILEDESIIADVTEIIDENNSRILSLTKVEPTLEDVFVSLVGRGLENENQSQN